MGTITKDDKSNDAFTLSAGVEKASASAPIRAVHDNTM